MNRRSLLRLLPALAVAMAAGPKVAAFPRNAPSRASAFGTAMLAGRAAYWPEWIHEDGTILEAIGDSYVATFRWVKAIERRDFGAAKLWRAKVIEV